MIQFETQPHRVLIIDDSLSISSFVDDLLSSAGYRVQIAHNGTAGLEAVTSFAPDVILLDVEMPGISGLEVLAELNRSVHYFSIIMFTSLSSLPQIVGALHQGADDYICKPFHNDELLARIEAAVRTARMKLQLAEARKSAEQTLSQLTIAQEKLVVEEKVAAVARLSAGVAHNINNPLGFILSNLASLDRYSTAILANSDELSQYIQGHGDECGNHVRELEKKHRIRQIRSDLKPLIQETREGFERIALIVKRLSRLELGLSLLQNSMSFNLVPSLESVTRSLPASVTGAVTFEWRCDVDELPVYGALTLFNAAIEELLTNAVEAMPGTGVITVTADRVNNEAVLAIHDTGCGVPEEKLSEICEPFYTTKPLEAHVGLGLTIAERFIDLIGGRMRIVSGAGTGTTVVVTIPLQC